MAICESKQSADDELSAELRTACTDGDLATVRRLYQTLNVQNKADVVTEMAKLAIDANQPDVLELCFLYHTVADSNLGIRAAAAGFVPIYQILVRNGLPVNEDFDYRGDALCIATRYNHIELMTYLIHSGAELNSSRLHSYILTPLAVAASMGSPEAISLLVSRGASVYETLALHFAASTGNLTHMRILIHAGANVNENPAPDNDITFANRGRLGTPLHFAAGGRQMDAIRLLLANGARPDLKDAAGRSVLERSCGPQDTVPWQELSEVLSGWGTQSASSAQQ